MRFTAVFSVLFVFLFLIATPYGLHADSEDYPLRLKPVPLDPESSLLFKAYESFYTDLYNEMNSGGKQNRLQQIDYVNKKTNSMMMSLPASTGTTWEQQVLDGIAAFLADRVKEELALSFLEQLKANLCIEGTDQRYFLQSSCKVADELKIGENSVYWSQVKSAFERDLIQLPYRVIRKIPEKGTRICDQPSVPREDARLIAQLALEIIINIQKGEDPFETIAGFSKLVGPDGHNCKDHQAICVLTLISKLVENLGYETIEPTMIMQMVDEIAPIIKSFVEANFGKPDKLDPPISMDQCITLAKKFIKLHNDIIDASKWAAQNAGKDGLGTFNRFARLTVKSLYFAGEVMNEIKVDESTSIKFIEFQKGLKATDHAVTAMEYVRANDYQHCILEVLMMINTVVGENDLPDWFKKYIPFVAEIASAENSDDVKKALENAAAPVGSYRIKRVNGKTTVAIGAAVGFIGGWEDMIRPENADSWAYGVFAPIGLTVDYGHTGCNVDHSVGMMIPLIDLGTLVQYRFTSGENEVKDENGDSKVDQQPSYGFMHVLSPGLYFVYGIPTLPLILGGGFSYAPQLRKVEDIENDKTTNEDILRYGIFLGFDIPIFPFTIK